MWVSFRVTRTGAALYSFLSTVTVDTVPGLAWISIVPEIGKVTPVGTMPPVIEEPEVPIPTWPMSLTWPSSMPQPIWYPASSVPPLRVVLPLPVTVPVNVPPTRYSRDETAVVSGATGS